MKSLTFREYWFEKTGTEIEREVYNLSIDCSGVGLTSLEGMPIKVMGSVDCSNNMLLSLEGLPKFIGGDLDLSKNPGNFNYLPNRICGKVIVH